MAIEKVEKKKLEFTAATIAMIGSSVVLGVFSLLLLYFAFANWRFKASLEAGYRAYDQNLVGQAAPSLKEALSWRPNHRGARELLAKIACDGGALDEAIGHYTALRKAGHNPAQVRIGMGVALLKKAEKAADPKAADELVGQAKAEFKAALGDAPEAELGLGHAELLLAWKLKEPARVDAARPIFEKVRKAVESDPVVRRKITRDGLVDLYAGLGKSLSPAPDAAPDALKAFQACTQISRRWLVPQAGILVLKARQFDRWTEGGDALLKLKPETTPLRNDTSNLFRRSREAAEVLADPWLAYTLSLARAYGRNGLIQEHQALVAELTRGGSGADNRIEPFLVDAQVRFDDASKEVPNLASQDAAVTRAVTSLQDLVRRLQGTDELGNERKARALNQLGWLQAWQGLYTNNKVKLGNAAKSFQDAAKLFPDDYVYNRNAALILKKAGAAAAAVLPHKDKAKAGATGDWEKDWDQVRGVIEP
jgi:tetratricopeptide (TPR) repeat protein